MSSSAAAALDLSNEATRVASNNEAEEAVEAMEEDEDDIVDHEANVEVVVVGTAEETEEVSWL